MGLQYTKNIKEFTVVDDGDYWHVKASYKKDPAKVDADKAVIDELHNNDEKIVERYIWKHNPGAEQKAADAAAELTASIKLRRPGTKG